VIHVVTAAIAGGEIQMTSNVEETGATGQPRVAKKATAGARRAHTGPTKAKAAKKATPAKKAPKVPKKTDGARHGSKAAQVLELLKRPGGASLQEIMKATEWQAHSVRGFLSGALRKKLALTVDSTKQDGGERTYCVKS
jgi:hypothetical protein